MIKKFMILIAFCFAINGLQAQEASPLRKTWTLGFTLLGAEAIGEFPVSKQSTVRIIAGGLFTTRAYEIQNEIDFLSLGLAYASSTYRFYYKFKDINRKNKPLLYNSGNFFYGKVAGYKPIFGNGLEVDSDFYATVGAGWGLQRMYQNKFVFAFGVGPGFDVTTERFDLFIDLTFGVRLSQKDND